MTDDVVAIADKIVDQARAYGFAGISANIQNAINDAVAAERERIIKWCKEKVRGHRELAIKRQDDGDDEMASTHIAIEGAYFELARELHETQERKETV